MVPQQDVYPLLCCPACSFSSLWEYGLRGFGESSLLTSISSAVVDVCTRWDFAQAASVCTVWHCMLAFSVLWRPQKELFYSNSDCIPDAHVTCYAQCSEAKKRPGMPFMVLIADGILLSPTGFLHSWRQISWRGVL